MIRFWLMLIMLLLLGPAVWAQQSTQRWGLVFETGFKPAWWIYHKGESSADQQHLGWDRTHYELKLDIGTKIYLLW